MKNIRTLLFVFLFINMTCAQLVVTEEVEFTNAKVNVSNDGRLFNNPYAGTSGYEIPIGSETRTIYSSDFWFGGILSNGDLGFLKTGSALSSRDSVWMILEIQHLLS